MLNVLVTRERLYSNEGELLEEKQWEFLGQQLICFIDEGGVTTEYTYDGAGRKITIASPSTDIVPD